MLRLDQTALEAPELFGNRTDQSQLCGRGGRRIKAEMGLNAAFQTGSKRHERSALPPMLHWRRLTLYQTLRGDAGCHGEIYRWLWETEYDSPTPLPCLGGH